MEIFRVYMIDCSIFLYLVTVACGVCLGYAKGRVLSGFIWTFLFGPFGLVVVCLLPDIKKRAFDATRALDARLHRIEAAIDALKEMQVKAREPKRPPRMLESKNKHSYEPPEQLPDSLAVMSGAANLGELPVATISEKLHAGELSPDDQFFDLPSATWQPLRALFS